MIGSQITLMLQIVARRIESMASRFNLARDEEAAGPDAAHEVVRNRRSLDP
jgi:hypothetical protein